MEAQARREGRQVAGEYIQSCISPRSITVILRTLKVYLTRVSSRKLDDFRWSIDQWLIQDNVWEDRVKTKGRAYGMSQARLNFLEVENVASLLSAGLGSAPHQKREIHILDLCNCRCHFHTIVYPEFEHTRSLKIWVQPCHEAPSWWTL